MFPILFEWGPLHLYSYGLSIAAGVLLAFVLMRKEALQSGFPTAEQAYDVIFVSVLTGFIGARLFYVVQHTGEFQDDFWSIFAVWQGGLIFYGGLAAGFFSLWIYAIKHHLSFLKLMDFILPYGAMVHAFGRLGCFLNGCCFGRELDAPWAVLFPGLEHAVHPTQLYEALYNLGVFMVLRSLYRGQFQTGNVTVFYLLLYGAGRFIIELYREGNPGWILTWNQWISIAIIGAGLLLFAVISKNKNSHSVKRESL